MDITESSGGLIYFPEKNELEQLASSNAGPEVDEAARLRLARYDGKPYYEDKIPEKITSSDGAEILSSLYVPIPVEEERHAMIFLFSCSGKEYSSIDVKRVQILCGQLMSDRMSRRKIPNLRCKEAFGG